MVGMANNNTFILELYLLKEECAIWGRPEREGHGDAIAEEGQKEIMVEIR